MRFNQCLIEKVCSVWIVLFMKCCLSVYSLFCASQIMGRGVHHHLKHTSTSISNRRQKDESKYLYCHLDNIHKTFVFNFNVFDSFREYWNINIISFSLLTPFEINSLKNEFWMFYGRSKLNLVSSHVTGRGTKLGSPLDPKSLNSLVTKLLVAK